jgi:hypothetical protein
MTDEGLKKLVKFVQDLAEEHNKLEANHNAFRERVIELEHNLKLDRARIADLERELHVAKHSPPLITRGVGQQ